jgi:cysteine desulfurase
VIYLDHNATTPIAPEVHAAMMPYLTDEWGNPASAYRFGSKLKTVIETARGAGRGTDCSKRSRYRSGQKQAC